MSKAGRRTGTIKRPKESATVQAVIPHQREAAQPHPPAGIAADVPGSESGEPLRELTEIRSFEGILEHALRLPAHAMQVEILRVRPGDHLKLRFDNGGTPLVTSAHLRSRGARPGDSPRLEYDIPADHPAGLHWYHAGFVDDAAGRTRRGLAAPIIIEGEIDRTRQISDLRERTLVLAGPPPGDTAPNRERHVGSVTINGQLRPGIEIRPGEVQRWRILNADSGLAVWLHVEGHTLHQIGQDGIPFAQPRPTRSIMLFPGNRAELLVRANRAGTYRIHAASDPHHAVPAQTAAELATLDVNGRPVFNRMPREFPEAPMIPAGPVINRRTLHLSDGAGDQDQHTITAGTVEEWTLINDDAVQRPIHLHANPFQVLDVQSTAPGGPCVRTDPGIWWDTYRVPPKGQVTIRTYIRPDITGTSVYRCQVAPSENQGLTDTLAVSPSATGAPTATAAAAAAPRQRG